MDALDGNAIAGALFEHFGNEMTGAQVRCSRCQTISMMAELRVYMKAPGAVARCPACDEVVMVIVDVRGAQRFDKSNMEMVSPPESALRAAPRTPIRPAPLPRLSDAAPGPGTSTCSRTSTRTWEKTQWRMSTSTRL